MLQRPFFDACDGIFLNYHWSGAHLAQSVQAAGRRKFDVYAVSSQGSLQKYLMLPGR